MINLDIKSGKIIKISIASLFMKLEEDLRAQKILRPDQIVEYGRDADFLNFEVFDVEKQPAIKP